MSEGPVPRPGSAVAPALVAFGLLIGVWELTVRVVGADPVVLPAPSRVAAALWDARADALRHALPTLVETFAGFAVSLALAVAVAVAMDRLPAVRRGLYPVLVASQTIPIVAIAPLLIIWFGFGLLPKILVIVLVTFFPIVVALLDGFASADPDAADLLRSIGAGDRDVFRKVRVPSALPSFFTGLRISITYAVIGAVFAEYVGAYEGLGIWLQIARNAYRTDLVLGAVAIVAALSVGLFLLVGAAERLVIPWYRERRVRR